MSVKGSTSSAAIPKPDSLPQPWWLSTDMSHQTKKKVLAEARADSTKIKYHLCKVRRAGSWELWWGVMAQSKANPPGESAYGHLPDGLQAGPRHSAPHLQFSVLICSCDEKPPEGNPAGTIQSCSLKEDLVPCSRIFNWITLTSST